MSKMLEIEHLNVSYGTHQALKNINLSIDKGKLIGVIGPSGSGKSTLFKAILGLIPIDSGTILINEQKLDAVRKEIAYIPQRIEIDWDFPILVKDAVLLGCYPRLGLFERPKEVDKELAMDCLERVGMKNYAGSHIGELSGGQKQRIFIARLLAQEAKYIFLDEPFVGVDILSEKIIIDLLKTLRDEGKTILIIHHDLMKVQDYFDELIVLDQKLVAAGSVNKIFKADLLEKAYGGPIALFKKKTEQEL